MLQGSRTYSRQYDHAGKEALEQAVLRELNQRRKIHSATEIKPPDSRGLQRRVHLGDAEWIFG